MDSAFLLYQAKRYAKEVRAYFVRSQFQPEFEGEDAKKLLALIEKAGGELPIGDKSDPEQIRMRTGMSKNEFKRAAGSLYKQRAVEIGKDSIRKL